mgnify:CR=1 FL=1
MNSVNSLQAVRYALHGQDELWISVVAGKRLRKVGRSLQVSAWKRPPLTNHTNNALLFVPDGPPTS